ncbi:MAG: di-trans,poly-cis-decaprenylcistransferase [Bryobacteraceae bacterium]
MNPSTFHVAVIMDGNGRWAADRGLPRIAGHRRGADAVRRTVEAAPGCGITMLTLYAFSSDNWRRPEEEINAIMRLFRTYLDQEVERCIANGVKLSVMGRRDRLPRAVTAAIAAAEAATRNCEALHLRLAVDYSSRDEMIRAARACAASEDWSRERWSAEVGQDVDLLIRTSGEQRLSDFLLWECAYAEMLFLQRRWPDFGARDLEEAVGWFHSRNRRFGAVSGSALAV